MRKTILIAACAATAVLGGVAHLATSADAQTRTRNNHYTPATGADRVSVAVSKNQRGTSVPIDHRALVRFCGDMDGCSVRIGMHNWDDTGRVASREFLFYYNPVNRAWRSSLGDPAGTDSNNVVEHANNSWACYMTDGEYQNWNGSDSRPGFGLLSWNQYNADCWITIID